MQNYVFDFNETSDSLYYDDSKFADYYDTKGNKTKVTVGCDKGSQAIVLSVGRHSYYYVNQSLPALNITISTLSELGIESGSGISNGYLANDYDVDNYYIANRKGKRVIKSFCDFYNNKGKAVDEKITASYLGNDCLVATVDFTDEICEAYYDVYGYTDVSYIKLGEFFKDDDGNVYFYDYVNTSSYSVGKELAKYVYR
jgi:hypothetical protein